MRGFPPGKPGKQKQARRRKGLEKTRATNAAHHKKKLFELKKREQKGEGFNS